MCVELDAIAAAVDGAARLPRPTGLGAAGVLADRSGVAVWAGRPILVETGEVG